MSIKIIVAAHKKYWMPTDPVYLPVHVGAEGKASIGYMPDNTGDNISSKNPHFCELTGLYWAWKNLDADYLGLVHYRRYFTRKEVHNIEAKKDQILTEKEWQQILSKHPVVVPDKRKYYIETNRSHYNHAHHRKGLDVTEQIIKEQCPEYLPAFEKVMNRTWATCLTCSLCDVIFITTICSGCSLFFLNWKDGSTSRAGIPMNPVSTALLANFSLTSGLNITISITPNRTSRLWKNRIGLKKVVPF